MGSDSTTPRKRRAFREGRRFWIDRADHEPTVPEFVAWTGHVTLAEIAPDRRTERASRDAASGVARLHAAGSSGRSPQLLQLVAVQRDANWRQPYGPGSSIDDDHPIVHVAFADVEAYAAWAGRLPRSRVGVRFRRRARRRQYAWGSEFTPAERHMANTWRGAFPNENLKTDGYEHVTVTAFAPTATASRHDRKRLGVDARLQYAARHADIAQSPLLRSRQSARGGWGRDYDPRSRSGSLARSSRGVACAELLRRYPAARHAAGDTSTAMRIPAHEPRPAAAPREDRPISKRADQLSMPDGIIVQRG